MKAPRRPIGQIPYVIGQPYDDCVYFALDHATGLIKIGKTFTGYLLSRLRDIERDLDRPVTLLAYTPGTWYDEQALHKRLSESREHGEWFRRSSAVDAAIKAATPAPEWVSYWGEWWWFR
jgi:hypothetical protein